MSLAQKAVEIEPYNGYYRNTLGVVCYRLGRYQEAVNHLERNSKLHPEFTAFDGYFLAMSYHRLGSPSTARAWFERSDTWTKQQSRLPAAQLAELAAFRAEAATVLGIEPPVPLRGGRVYQTVTGRSRHLGIDQRQRISPKRLS